MAYLGVRTIPLSDNNPQAKTHWKQGLGLYMIYGLWFMVRVSVRLLLPEFLSGVLSQKFVRKLLFWCILSSIFIVIDIPKHSTVTVEYNGRLQRQLHSVA